MLSVAGPFLEQQMHPTVIIGAFRQALDDLLTILKDQVSIAVDVNDRAEMTRIIKSCIGTKFITKWSVHTVLSWQGEGSCLLNSSLLEDLLLVIIFFSKIQHLGLKIPCFGKICGQKLKVWAPVIPLLEKCACVADNAMSINRFDPRRR